MSRLVARRSAVNSSRPRAGAPESFDFQREFTVVGSSANTTGWDLDIGPDPGAAGATESIVLGNNYALCTGGGYNAGSHYARVKRRFEVADAATPKFAGRFVVYAEVEPLGSTFYTDIGQSSGRYMRFVNSDNSNLMVAEEVRAAVYVEGGTPSLKVGAAHENGEIIVYHNFGSGSAATMVPVNTVTALELDVTPNTHGLLDGAFTFKINGAVVASGSNMKTMPADTVASERFVSRVVGGIDGMYNADVPPSVSLRLHKLSIKANI